MTDGPAPIEAPQVHVPAPKAVAVSVPRAPEVRAVQEIPVESPVIPVPEPNSLTEAQQLGEQIEKAADGIPPKTEENADAALNTLRMPLALPAAGQSSNPNNTLTPEVQPQEVAERVTGEPVPLGVKDMTHYMLNLADEQQRWKQTFDINKFNEDYERKYINTPQASESNPPQEITVNIIPGTNIPFPHGVSNPDRPLFTHVFMTYAQQHADIPLTDIDFEEIRRLMRDEKIRRAQQPATGALNGEEGKEVQQKPIILGAAPEEKKKESVKPKDELPEDKKTEETSDGEKKQEPQLTEEQINALIAEATEVAKRYPHEMRDLIMQTRNVRDAVRYLNLYKKNNEELDLELELVDAHIVALQNNLQVETLDEWQIHQMKSDIARERMYKKHIEKVQNLSQDTTEAGKRKKAEEEIKAKVELQRHEHQLFEAVQNLQGIVSKAFLDELYRETRQIPQLESIIKHGVSLALLQENGMSILESILEALLRALAKSGKEIVGIQ